MHSGMMINAADQSRYGAAMSLLWGHGAFGIVFFFTDLLIDGYRLLIFRSRLVHDLDIEGIVLKQGAPTDLPKALAALQKGKKFTPESVSRLLEKISAGGYGDKRLSPKESEVLRLFAEGFLVTEIAKKLNRSIKTISSQKKSAMMKLGVENDIALLNYLSSVTLSPADKD